MNPDAIKQVADEMAIVYTPLHGTGATVVPQLLKKAGLKKLYTVDEQMVPDGNFPTVKFPNPEFPQAFDLGRVIADRVGSDLIVAEANHDEEWVKTGPYPAFLKLRVLGDYGHLSNETGALLVQRAVEQGARTVLLAHLSSENNTPARARNTVAWHLNNVGIDPERDIDLTVAPRSELSKVYRLERGMDAQVFSWKEAAGC